LTRSPFLKTVTIFVNSVVNYFNYHATAVILHQPSKLTQARWPGATKNLCRATKKSQLLDFSGPIGPPNVETIVQIIVWIICKFVTSTNNSWFVTKKKEKRERSSITEIWNNCRGAHFFSLPLSLFSFSLSPLYSPVCKQSHMHAARYFLVQFFSARSGL